MSQEMYLLKDVAQKLGKRPHQIVYALTSGQVPEVRLKVAGRRLFQPADIRRLARFFGVSLPGPVAEGEACPTNT